MTIFPRFLLFNLDIFPKFHINIKSTLDDMQCARASTLAFKLELCPSEMWTLQYECTMRHQRGWVGERVSKNKVCNYYYCCYDAMFGYPGKSSQTSMKWLALSHKAISGCVCQLARLKPMFTGIYCTLIMPRISIKAKKFQLCLLKDLANWFNCLLTGVVCL